MTLARYFSRLFVGRFLAVLCALCALVELLEMLDAVRHLVGTNAGLHNVLVFSALRLPLAMEQLFLLAVLIGGMLTFRALAQSNAMTVLRSAGMSPYRLLAGLLPLTLVLAAAYYGIVDWGAPAAERSFADWWQTVSVQDEEDEPEARGTVWLRYEGEIVSVTKVAEDGRGLIGLTRYLRNPDGTLSGRIRAASAENDGGVWRLHDAEVLTLAGGTPEVTHHPELNWTGGPQPENFEELALPTRRMQSVKSREVLNGQWAGIAAAAHYRTLMQRSYSAPFLPFLMLLLATPALAGNGRQSSSRGMAVAISLGLLFLVAAGFLSSMSEAGALPPVIAIWTAPLAFAALGFSLLLHDEE
jgi:lipopolysaccharide export system permease protein